MEQVSPREGKARDTVQQPSYARLVALAGLLLVVGSGVAYTFDPAWGLATQASAGLGLALLLLAVLMRPDAVRTILTGRPVRYGSNAVIMSLAFIALLALLNFLSLQANWELDLTETGEFTLSEQTIRILQAIDRPVQVIGFFQAGDGRLKQAENYLERYSRYTDKLTYEFHDPQAEPALARSLELSKYGLVFISNDNRYEATTVDEQTITGGLMRVTSLRQKAVYFLTGHGDYRVEDSAPDGYSMVRQALERENYRVGELNLAARTAVPTDTQVMILAGAKHQLAAGESRLISDWMKQGGRLLLLVDPLAPVPLKGMLSQYGLSLLDGFVVDMSDSLVTLTPNGLSQQVTAPLVSRYPFHEITRSLSGSRTFFPFARALRIGPAAPQNWAAPIVATSHSSWVETNVESPDLKYNEGVDLPGPVSIGAAAEDKQSGARLVVLGNASFITNQSLSSDVANEDLFLNAVNWLAEDEELISIRPKSPTSRQIVLTPLQHSMTLLTTLLVMPLALLTVGVAMWWKRR